MVTQMQLEVILAGNRIYSHRRLVSRGNNRVNKEENGKRKLFLDPCCLTINCHVRKFGIQSKRKTEKKRKWAAGQRSLTKKGDRDL